ncbi:MAG TPA: hypothetical protein VII50_12735 [Acidothermaceae bacterium]
MNVAPELSPGSPAPGPAAVFGDALADALGAWLGDAGLVDVAAAGADVAAAAPTAVEPAVDGAADVLAEVAAAVEPGADGPADLVVAVHPAVTRAGTSTSAAAIRRIPPSSRILRRWGPV